MGKRSGKSFIGLFILLIGISVNLHAQCTGGSAGGAIAAPTTSWQTVCIAGGVYRTFSATAGITYHFSFCQGGASTSFDTEISILDNSGVAVAGGYNDDFCGTNSELVFIAPTTSTYRILISEYGCLANATCQTLAYRYTAPFNDNICKATYIYGNSCTCNFSTYSNVLATGSPQANPGCASYLGGDVWFATKVPASGRLNMNAQAGTITDGAMAVYKGASCSGALTLLGCDDDSGPASSGDYMPLLNFTGLTPGDSLFIRFWSYDNAESGSFGLCIYDPAPYYCMVGNASELSTTGTGRCIEVTPNKLNQKSCIWNTTQIDMNTIFDYTYTVNLGSSDAGADGLTFTLQNNPAGTSACGDPGGSLGIGPLTNTLSVEFDTYDNGAGNGDIPDDHIAINANGDFSSPVAGPVFTAATAQNIEDGADHTVRITWDPVAMIYSVYFNGLLRLSYNNDIIANVFGGNPNVYWGFTGSTGSLTNTQILCPGNLPGVPPSLPVEWGAFEAELVNDKAFISWTTFSEKNNKEFLIERSQDGLKFSSIGIVQGLGNSSVKAKYQFMDPAPLSGNSFYRIIQVDLNGGYSYSPIQKIHNAKPSSKDNNFCKIYPNPATPSSLLTADLKEDASLQVYDNLGNIILNEDLHQGLNSLNILEGYLQDGIYHFVLRGSVSSQYITLVVTGK